MENSPEVNNYKTWIQNKNQWPKDTEERTEPDIHWWEINTWRKGVVWSKLLVSVTFRLGTWPVLGDEGVNKKSIVSMVKESTDDGQSENVRKERDREDIFKFCLPVSLADYWTTHETGSEHLS